METDLFFRPGNQLEEHRSVPLIMRNVPILLLLFAAGCSSTPEPRAQHRRQSPHVNGTARAVPPACAIAARRSRISRCACAARHTATVARRSTASTAAASCSTRIGSSGSAVPRTSRDQADEAQSIKPRKLRRGDLVFFKVGSRKVNHVGIYIGDHRFVHAPGAGKPVTINSLDDEFYADAFFSAGRFWNRLPN